MNPASILSTNAEIKCLKTKPSTNPAAFRCFRGSLKAVAPQPKCIRWPVLNPKPALRRPDIPPGRCSACRDLCSLYLHVSCCTSVEPLVSSFFRNRLRKRNLRVNKVKPTLPISQRSPKAWAPATNILVFRRSTFTGWLLHLGVPARYHSQGDSTEDQIPHVFLMPKG